MLGVRAILPATFPYVNARVPARQCHPGDFFPPVRVRTLLECGYRPRLRPGHGTQLHAVQVRRMRRLVSFRPNDSGLLINTGDAYECRTTNWRSER